MSACPCHFYTSLACHLNAVTSTEMKLWFPHSSLSLLSACLTDSDHSMIGSRDSEMAVKIEEQVPTTANAGAGSKLEGCIRDFRMRLMGRHFGVPIEDRLSRDWVDLSDPASDHIWNFLRSRALANTGHFQKVSKKRCHGIELICSCCDHDSTHHNAHKVCLSQVAFLALCFLTPILLAFSWP